MNKKSLLLISAISLLISACGSTMPKMPKWYLNPPSKKGYLYATGSEISTKMQTAVNEARDVAFNALAQQIDAETNRDADRAQQEIGDEVLVNQFTDKSRSILSQQLKNVKVIEREVVSDNKKYRRLYESLKCSGLPGNCCSPSSWCTTNHASCRVSRNTILSLK